MTTLLFLLLIFFVVIPLFKSAVAIYRARRAARQFFDQFRQQAAGRRAPDPDPQPAPQKSKKKIDPEDGEFVQFEDLPADGSEYSRAYTEVKVEQQIVDVEWEDLTASK